MKLLALMTIFLIIVSCSRGVLRVGSTTGKAQIKLIEESGEVIELGETPFETYYGDIFRRSKYVYLVGQLDDHVDQKVLLMSPPTETDVNLTFNFEKRIEDVSSFENKKNLEKVSVDVARSYKLINAKRYSDAERILFDLKDNFPNLSIVYDFLGNIEYLKNNYNKAFLYYNKAQSLSSGNVERELLINKMRRMNSQ